MMTMVVQKWEESERGWGIRPDGYSLHPDKAARDRFIDAYWEDMPDEVPDSYSRPSGTPYVVENLQGIVFDGKDGIRFWDNNYPGDGGKDGWKSIKEKV